MNSFSYFFVFGLLSQSLLLVKGNPVEIPHRGEDDSATYIPILQPETVPEEEVNEPQPLQPPPEDYTDYPILQPEGPSQDADYEDDYSNSDEFVVERPLPEGLGVAEDSDGESNEAIPRPQPEGDELNDPESAAVVYPAFRKRRETEDDTEDDTVVIEAATCEELERLCYEEGDLFACSAYTEDPRCNGDERSNNEFNEMVDCTHNGGENNANCPHLAQ